MAANVSIYAKVHYSFYHTIFFNPCNSSIWRIKRVWIIIAQIQITLILNHLVFIHSSTFQTSF